MMNFSEKSTERIFELVFNSFTYVSISQNKFEIKINQGWPKE